MNRKNGTEYSCLAVDLGASSGRVIAGHFDGQKLRLEQVHRFSNGPVERGGTLYWDFDSLLREIRKGLKKGIAIGIKNLAPVRSIGIDSWGVDFGLIDDRGNLVSQPVHYRDKRTQGVMESIFETLVPRRDIFEKTGIQFLQFNTIYQLYALKKTAPGDLEKAQTFLMMSDLAEYFLTGKAACEFTNASTTQLYDPLKKGWSDELIEKLGLPRRIFPKILSPGTKLGQLREDVARDLGSLDPEVIAVATHDTGSAVAAVPTEEENFAYLSSGTWSLLGTEMKEPVITGKALELNFTNEGGVEGTFRLLKNIMGLWLLQESRSEWERKGRQYSWEEISQMGEGAEPFCSFVDPDSPLFLPPGDMPSRIQSFCRDTDQPVPESDAEIVRCVMESLCMKYLDTLNQLESLTGKSLKKIYAVGGGVQNRALCQWTADACGREVVAGPVEATAIGNVGMQLVCAGITQNLSGLRSIIRQSFEPDHYVPRNATEWEKAFKKYKSVIK